MSVVDDILGCPLLEITRSFWAVKMDSGKFLCQRQHVHNWQEGSWRYLDWYKDIVATQDHKHVTELWLLCPKNDVSPVGNSIRIPIVTVCTGFQFNISTVDIAGFSQLDQTLQAQVIGRLTNSDGDCECVAFDPILGGVVTYETTLYDPVLKGPAVNDDGSIFYPLRTNVLRFGWRVKQGQVTRGMWRDSLAPIGALALDRLGVEL
jgi:hypothetical protein